MSPEQLGGGRELVEAPADVWGLGVVLYETLTGQRPFGGDTLVQLMGSIEAARPPAPRALDPTIPPALEVAARNRRLRLGATSGTSRARGALAPQPPRRRRSS